MVGNGEELTGGREKYSILSDCLEALIGYIEVVGGSEQSKQFVVSHIYRHYSDDLLPQKTSKSLLQERCQKYYQTVPEYRIQEVEVSDSGNIELFRATVVIA
jgi:ribonuclease-3